MFKQRECTHDRTRRDGQGQQGGHTRQRTGRHVIAVDAQIEISAIMDANEAGMQAQQQGQGGNYGGCMGNHFGQG